MSNELKNKIINNGFAYKLREQLIIDRDDYKELRQLLTELAVELGKKDTVDKELVLVLYTIPQMVRNTFLSFSKNDSTMNEFVSELEDIWIDLDGMILECLSS